MNFNTSDFKGEINRTKKRGYEFLCNGTFTFEYYFVILSAPI